MPRIARTVPGAVEADACKPSSSPTVRNTSRQHACHAPRRPLVGGRLRFPAPYRPCGRRDVLQTLGTRLEHNSGPRCSHENSASPCAHVGSAVYRSARVHRSHGRAGATADSVGVGSADADSYADSTTASAEARSGADRPEASIPDPSSPSDAPSAGRVRRLGSSDVG